MGKFFIALPTTPKIRKFFNLKKFRLYGNTYVSREGSIFKCEIFFACMVAVLVWLKSLVHCEKCIHSCKKFKIYVDTKLMLGSTVIF